ncbi:MAG TPA: VOC family protein [Ktedonobacterales bacterium]|nr:VOC family protein [Ktedonobacterales bacterium]
MKIINVRLLTGDFAATLHFWRDVMQLPVAYGDEVMGYAYLTAGDVGVELMGRDTFAEALGDATPAPAAGRQTVLVFNVEDVDATYADLVVRGAAPVHAPVDRPEWQARTAHVADPDGQLVEIYEKLEAAETPTI